MNTSLNRFSATEIDDIKLLKELFSKYVYLTNRNLSFEISNRDFEIIIFTLKCLLYSFKIIQKKESVGLCKLLLNNIVCAFILKSSN